VEKHLHVAPWILVDFSALDVLLCGDTSIKVGMDRGGRSCQIQQKTFSEIGFQSWIPLIPVILAT
jgi:hypothetical protein